MINIEKTSAPRVIIGKHLSSLIEKNNKIIVIDNDLGTSTSSYDVTKTFPKNLKNWRKAKEKKKRKGKEKKRLKGWRYLLDPD